MKFPLWTIIPSIFLLTLLFLALGFNGHWRYTTNEFVFGNLLVCGFIGKCYVGEYFYKRFKK